MMQRSIGVARWTTGLSNVGSADKTVRALLGELVYGAKDWVVLGTGQSCCGGAETMGARQSGIRGMWKDTRGGDCTLYTSVGVVVTQIVA